MKNRVKVLLISLCVLGVLQGCATVEEISKKVWGSSTQALEEARADALSKTFSCDYEDCFDAVLGLERKTKSYGLSHDIPLETVEDSPIPTTTVGKKEILDDGFFDIFIRDKIKGIIVVMGIKGNVNTTEVGIFFSKLGSKTTKIEVSSLSTSAKVRVAEFLFKELGSRFSSESKSFQ